ncbi:uncharacterized protein LOC130715426 [Lotus japonicus]|uniref:uncharacterized protein LOC130715426 n=1 Tax=Lotus japonicus TaxID=34305 RepID=UPI00258F149F|nr:uncharacterized protein LOC130715426 [Lotus japonicus]
MSNIKKSVRDNDKYSSIYGFSLALSVFALERFPFIRVEYAPVSDYPLFFRWMKIVYKPFKQTQTVKGVKAFLDRFRGLRKEDVTWQPYIDRPAQCHTYQLDMIYAYVPCIHFADIALNRADLCYEQLGLRMEDLRMPLPTIEKRR